MKRLLALVISFFYAVTNNVSMVASDPVVFDEAKYYVIEDTDNLTSEELEERRTRPDETASDEPYSETNVVITNNGKYWCKAGSKSNFSDYSKHVSNDNKTIVWNGNENNMNIICPEEAVITYDCKSDSSGHHNLTLKTNSGFDIVIEDMKCWYSDKGRKEPSDGMWSGGPDISNKTLKAKNVIGIAKSGTRLKIYKDGKQVDPSTFFG